MQYIVKVKKIIPGDVIITLYLTHIFDYSRQGDGAYLSFNINKARRYVIKKNADKAAKHYNGEVIEI
jgi:hypothetical protein